MIKFWWIICSSVCRFLMDAKAVVWVKLLHMRHGTTVSMFHRSQIVQEYIWGEVCVKQPWKNHDTGLKKRQTKVASCYQRHLDSPVKIGTRCHHCFTVCVCGCSLHQYLLLPLKCQALHVERLRVTKAMVQAMAPSPPPHIDYWWALTNRAANKKSKH